MAKAALVTAALVLFARAQGYPCNWTDGNHTLDLSSWQGSVLSATEDGGSLLSWDVCSDALPCNGDSWMGKQLATNGNCRGTAKFDDTQPYFTSDTRVWRFVYKNGEATYCSSNRQTILEITCDKNYAKGQYTAVAKEPDTCQYQMDVTMPCHKGPADDGCKWSVGGNTLDLSAWKGQTIAATEDGGSVISWMVCQDGLSCNGDSWMAKLLATNSNCRGLAKFDSTGPTYSSNTGAWRFDYTNGESTYCSQNREFILQVICDSSYSPGQYSATASEPDICEYQMVVRMNCNKA